MGLFLLPVVVFAFFIGILNVNRLASDNILPPSSSIQAAESGQTFVRYCNAIARYMNSNPTFTGTVSNAALTAQGDQFPALYLTSAGNAVTATGVSGRIITCYAALPTGAITEAINAADGDASIGIATGTNWLSAAYGSTVQPLASIVPNGDVVSVIQIGN